jgi:dTDP-glucose 4,6-dehydratase
MIPLFVTNLIDGIKVPLYGDGLNIRDWLHVEDHCRGIAAVIEKGKSGEIYNIGGGTELTNIEITHMILKICDKDESFINPVADRLGHDRRYSVNWSKSHNELGYSPVHTLASALPEIIDWYRKNESWWRPLKK